MARLSLWKDGKHSNDYKFIDRRISEMFTIGGTGINLHKYLGTIDQGETGDLTKPTYLNQSEKNIQDLLFVENRDRKYDTSVYTMRGIYQRQDSDFDLTQFGLFLQTGTLFMTFHLRDMVDQIGRKLMSGDVVELMHLKDYDALDQDVPAALKRYYVVGDCSFASEGFSPTWWPHLWRVKLNPLVDGQEYKDILNNIAAGDNTDSSLGDLLSTYDKYIGINDAVIAQAEVELPKSGYDTSHIYIKPLEADGTLANVSGTASGSPPVTSIDTKIKGYLVGDGLEPNQYIDSVETPDLTAVETGISFPASPAVGDYFLRLDFLPNRLFRYSGTRWVKIEDAVRTNLTPGATNNTTMRSGFFKNTATFTEGSITAGSFAIGTKYKILLAGNTNFTAIGSTSNTVGTVFTATGSGTGTGAAAQVHNERQSLSKALTPKADN